MRIYLTLLLFQILFFQVHVHSQSSFRVLLENCGTASEITEYPNGDLLFNTLLYKEAIDENLNTFALFPTHIKLNSQGEFIFSKSLEDLEHPSVTIEETTSYVKDNRIYSHYAYNAGPGIGIVSGIAKSDFTGNFEWFREIPAPGLNHGENFLIAQNDLSSDVYIFVRQNIKMGIAKVDDNGELLENKGIRLIRNGIHIPYTFGVNTFDLKENGNFLVGVNGRIDSEPGVPSPDQRGILHHIDNTGQTISLKSISDFAIEEIKVLSNSHILLGGSYREQTSTGYTYSPTLIMLDDNQEFLWSKVFTDESIEGSDLTFDFDSEGNLIISLRKKYAPYVSLIKLNPDFELIWAKTYSGAPIGRKANVKVTQDNGIIFFNSHLDTTTYKSYLVLTKTDSNGNLPDNLPVAEFCYRQPVNLPFTVIEESFSEVDLTFIESATTDLVNQDQTFTQVDLPLPPFPLPDFNLPDSICADQCTAPTGLKNQYADTFDWLFEGAETDTSAAENPGQVCWSEAGTYTVRQIISFQNCLDTFQTQITVIADPQPDLDSLLVLCEEEQIVLDGSTAAADRYRWSTGATEPIIYPTAPGIYVLTAENSHCRTEDTTEVRIVGDDFTEDPVRLPADTLICATDFPVLLSATLPYSDTGAWADGSRANPRSVTAFGTYTFTTEIEGCTYSQFVRITEEDCSARIYLPDAFSPDFDGINDVFEPLGTGFAVTDFSIYDRWGGLVFQSTGAAWDGRQAGKFLENGVFVYVLNFVNTRTGETGRRTGNVTVLR